MMKEERSALDEKAQKISDNMSARKARALLGIINKQERLAANRRTTASEQNVHYCGNFHAQAVQSLVRDGCLRYTVNRNVVRATNLGRIVAGFDPYPDPEDKQIPLFDGPPGGMWPEGEPLEQSVRADAGLLLEHVYVVHHAHYVCGIFSTEKKAIEVAHAVHSTNGFKYSAWVTRNKIDTDSRGEEWEEEIGMYKRFPNGPRQESPWIPFAEPWEYDDIGPTKKYESVYDSPVAWVPRH